MIISHDYESNLHLDTTLFPWKKIFSTRGKGKNRVRVSCYSFSRWLIKTTRKPKRNLREEAVTQLNLLKVHWTRFYHHHIKYKIVNQENFGWVSINYDWRRDACFVPILMNLYLNQWPLRIKVAKKKRKNRFLFCWTVKSGNMCRPYVRKYHFFPPIILSVALFYENKLSGGRCGTLYKRWAEKKGGGVFFPCRLLCFSITVNTGWTNNALNGRMEKAFGTKFVEIQVDRSIRYSR